MIELVLAGALLLALAGLSLLIARGLRVESGLPGGRVVQSDMGGGTRGKRLRSERYGLTGTPDYLVETPRGLVPVEVKPMRAEKEPLVSHLLQVLAYCLLVEETTGKAPTHGLLRYSADTFRVDYNRDTRAYLLAVMEEMRRARQVPEVRRSHEHPARCAGCGYRPVCEERLV